MEWLGWTLATASLAGLSFFVFTAGNLLPRALAHHRWYREKFPEYPPERRALIPGGLSGRALTQGAGLLAAALDTLRALGRAVVTVDDRWYPAGAVLGV